MKEIFIKINSRSLGDTLAATPSIRKVSKCYNRKINIVTHVEEIFENNPYVKKIYSFEEFSKLNLEKDYEIFETFCGIGEKNKYGVEKKHATIDIRRFHAMDLGFDLLPEEMHYDFVPSSDRYINIQKRYICLHISKTWDSRTYDSEKWQKIIDFLEKNDYYVVLLGKNGFESGFFNIDKSIQSLKLTYGIDLTNKLNLSQLWYVLNEALCVITMDSGILHFAGTTDTHIIQLGSSINNQLRSPYRNGKQDYKYNYISGPCGIFCASDMKYGIKEWGSINGVPPLVKCLENKSTFECHPDPQIVCDKISNLFQFKQLPKKKYLFIAGHLSTGGAPNYLFWLIKKFKNQNAEIKVLEWNLYSDCYVVHRNLIIDLVSKENFKSVGYYNEQDEIFYPKEQSIKDFILDYAPDYIHINDFVEQIAIKPMSKNFLDFLYDKNRVYKICETPHDSITNVNQKTYLPDEFWFCTPYHIEKYNRKDIPAYLFEMEINHKIRPDRNTILKSLNLDPNCIHVLQVGLFTENKNQNYTFELAKKFIGKKIKFHFVGNTCFIDSCKIDVNQSNCKIWGERSDVDVFMSCMDLFILPSKAELNPVSLKEALAWSMPCLISKLPTLTHLKNSSIKYIEDIDVFEYINNIILNHTMFLDFNISDTNKINCKFFPTPKIEINGDESFTYKVEFIDKKTNTIHHSGVISNNMWICCNVQYFCDWRVSVKNLILDQEHIFDLNLKDKKIKIINESPSLGDFIAWMPYVEKFRNLHNCYIDFFTPNKALFESQYANINFFNYDQQDFNNDQYYTCYKIGCFNSDDINLSPKDYRLIGLQNIACSILGLDYEEIIPQLYVENKIRHLNEKYVCISTASTAGCKHWQFTDGWQKVVDYLNEKGYKVVVIQKEPLDYMDLKGLKNIIHPETKSIQDAITWLYNCEFFIGLSSGISWLAWALNKKIVMISGFTKTFNEFQTPYRLINENVCHGCWNENDYRFDSSDWNWCPKYKNTDQQFECSKSITFEMVKSFIDELSIDNGSDLEMKNFDSFTFEEIFKTDQYQKFVKVKNQDFVLDLGCSKGYFYFKNKNKNISYIGVDGSIDCLKDFLENLENDKNPKLINAVIDENKKIIDFPSMFHGNIINKSLSISFPDLMFLLNRNIDFLKFDIEGYEKFFLHDHLNLFKSNIKNFSGEFHFTSSVFNRNFGIEILNNLKNDSQIKFKLFSIDGFEITNSFWSNTDYYTEIIISGYVENNINSLTI